MSLFSMLGWKLSIEKLLAYSTICKVLGGEFDLGISEDSLTTVCNTTERVQESYEKLDRVIQDGKFKRSEKGG
jgi:hypothetical protein